MGSAHRLGLREFNLVSDSFNGRILADSYQRQVVDYTTWEIGNKGERSYGSEVSYQNQMKLLSGLKPNSADSGFRPKPS